MTDHENTWKNPGTTRFHVEIGTKAIRILRQPTLKAYLEAAYRKFDNSISPDMLKIFISDMQYRSAWCLYTKKEMTRKRYIRITIDVPGGVHTEERKQELLQWTIRACQAYEEKYADETEVAVRIREIHEGAFVRVNAGPDGWLSTTEKLKSLFGEGRRSGSLSS